MIHALLRHAPLLAGVFLLAAGLLLTRPGAWVGTGNLAPMLVWATVLAAGAWFAKRWLAWPGVLAVAALACLPLLSFAGLGLLAATALLVLASTGLGSLWLEDEQPDAVSATILGLGLIAGVSAWLLPLPLFRAPLLAGLLLAITVIRRAHITRQMRAFAAAMSTGTNAAPRAALAFAIVWAVASMPAWLPPVTADDLALHLQLPTQLARDGYYRFDVGSQVWSLAPMLGDVLHGLLRVIGGGEAIGPLNTLWLLLAGLGAQRIGMAIGLSPSLSWLTAALYVSLPLSGALTMGLQSETPTAAVLACLAVLVLEAPAQAHSRRFQALALLAGFLLGLKVLNAIAIASLGLLLLWRWHGRLPWRGMPMALLLGFLIGGASYTYAWALAGNPVLPLYNGIFASPWYPVENFLDRTWAKGIDWLLPWQLTFASHEYFEGQPGAAGFALLALLGGTAGALLQPRLRPLLLAAIATWLLPLLPIQYLRYAHPSLVLLLPVLLAGLAGLTRPRLLSAAGWALVVLQLLFQPTASWILAGKAVRDLLGKGTDSVLVRFAPERLLARQAKALLLPGDRILIASRQAPYRAEFGERAFVANWYDHELQALAYGSENAVSWHHAVEYAGATHILVRLEHANPVLHEFVASPGMVEIARAGNAVLYRLPMVQVPGQATQNGREQTVVFDMARDYPVLADAEVTLRCAHPAMNIAIRWSSPNSPRLAHHAWITCDEQSRARSRVQVSASRASAILVFTAHPVIDSDPPIQVESHGITVRRDLARSRDLGRPIREAMCPRRLCRPDDMVLLADGR